jgi:predicted alpha/beta-fold hydrolase
MSAFEPRESLRNGHWMTLFSWANPRYFPALPRPTRRYFDVAPDARVVADCHWQPTRWERPTLLALHGLNGSSDAHYMKGIAAKAFARGMNVVRLNQRNCGGTEHLSAGLFHSGLTADAAHVVHELTTVDGLPAMGIAGYSLGGNLALKLAGEYGTHAPRSVVAVAAVSPIIEIEECTRALERPENVLYNWNFVKDLKRRMRRKDRLDPGRFDVTKLDAVTTVRQFDAAFTAPHFGFRSAEDYYYRASSMRVIDRIAIPALIITAEDDPFVPSQPFRDVAVTANPHIELHLCAHGGHCGFVGANSRADDGYWAETTIVDFVERHAATVIRT